MVVSDPKNPDNEGKVFLYKFGKKIFDKIMESMNPEFEDETPVNPFDYWTGANFRLKVRKVAGFINYDKSEFDSPSELYDGDDTKLEELWKTQHDLNEFISPEQFKSYDELKERLQTVLGDGDTTIATSAESVEVDTSIAPAESETPVTTNTSDNDEGDDALSYFERLASED